MIFGFVISPNRTILERLEDARRRKMRIRCPVCDWQPAPHDTWCCSPGCGQIWNTFKTRGVCPGCSHHWTHTACLRCSVWSPHEAWYEEQDED